MSLDSSALIPVRQQSPSKVHVPTEFCFCVFVDVWFWGQIVHSLSDSQRDLRRLPSRQMNRLYCVPWSAALAPLDLRFNVLPSPFFLPGVFSMSYFPSSSPMNWLIDWLIDQKRTSLVLKAARHSTDRKYTRHSLTYYGLGFRTGCCMSCPEQSRTEIC